jgi:hypothetical protein
MSWKVALIGVVVCSVLGLIPVVGWLIKLVFFSLAFGVVVKYKWHIIKNFR